MEVLIRIIIPILLPIALGILLSCIDKNNNKELLNNLTKEHIILRMPKAYMWIGCIDISFFAACLVLMAFFPNGTADLWVWVLFSLFLLPGVMIVFASAVWKMEIFRNEDWFLLRTVTLKTHRIQYCECISFRLRGDSLILKTHKGTFRIDWKVTNFEYLTAMLTQHKVKEIK